MEGLRAWRGLLSNRPLTRLLLGEFVSGIGDSLYFVAIFVVIHRESGDAALLGLFGALRMVPYVLFAVPAGVVADRFDRRLVLLASDLWRGSMMVGMALLLAAHADVRWVAALAVLATVGSSFFYPAIGAYIPALVSDERQLAPANSAWATLGNVSAVVGPALGGAIVATGDVLPAFVLNAATFALSGAILCTLPPSFGRPASPGSGERAVPRLSSLPLRPLAGLCLATLLVSFLGGGLQSSTVVIAVDVLESGEAANGYLNAAYGVGGLLGAMASGAFVLRRAPRVPLLFGTVVAGAAAIALGTAGAGGLALALVAMGALAAGFLLMDVVSTTIFQRLVPDPLRGRVLGILMALATAFGAAGALVMPVLIRGAGDRPGLGAFATFFGAGVGVVAVTTLGAILIGRAADRAPSAHETLVARIAALPLFDGVPAARLDAAMQAFREVPVRAGQVVVRQGDAADRFYVVARGAFSVTRVASDGAGDAKLLRRLGPDEVFGELGLLDNGPRTASVTADGDGLLLALDARDFLDLVGASGTLRDSLVHRGRGRS
jgi:MFS family permease